jgi:putative endonuclease
MAEHNEIGKIGETLAKTFLMKRDFTILETNYRTKYGEIDIVAKKDNVLRFIEVKSVKVRDHTNIETLKVKPEDNLTFEKWSKLITTIKIYLNSHNNSLREVTYQVDLACVYISPEKREGRVRIIENINKERG